MAMLACLAAGRPFLALDAAAPEDWTGLTLAEARPALTLGPGDLAAPPAAADWRPAALGVDEPACVLFTSGSTGRPKGVVNSQRGLLQRAAQSINAAHIGPEDRLLSLAPLSTIVGVRDAVTALLAGASLHLMDPGRAGAHRIQDVVRAEGISILFAFPALLRSVLGHGAVEPAPSLRMVRLGGDTLLWSDVDRLRAWLGPTGAIQQIYAATEAPMMQWFVDEAARGEDPRVPIGFPLPGNPLAIVDESGASVGPGEVGELVAGGAHLALGHWVDGALRRFEPPLFRTGDLVRLRPDGLLERLGRRDRQVKIRGVRVELDGVEAALRRHPGVRDVGVLARPGAGGGELALAAHIVPEGEGGADLLRELKAFAAGLPPAQRPSRIHLAARIPRLPSSKLDVAALAAMDEARIAEERAAGPSPGGAAARSADALEAVVAAAWRSVLGAPPASAEADFFDTGGDSLKAITLALELEDALGVELSLTLINQSPRFGDLVEALRERRTQAWVPLVELMAGEPGAAPLFFVHGAGGNVADLFPIARSMDWTGPVIGVQARGLAGPEPPHPSVEAMAEAYLDAVRVRQPHGPYRLCGYSFGGLVAFEMACRLKAAGEEVALLGLFDAAPSALGWPLRVWAEVAWRRLKGLAAGRLDRGPGLGEAMKLAPGPVLKVAANALMAAARYRPGVFPGVLTLFTPVDRDPALPAPEAVWARHAEALEVVLLRGAHLTMLAPPHAAFAAAALTRRLEKT